MDRKFIDAATAVINGDLSRRAEMEAAADEIRSVFSEFRGKTTGYIYKCLRPDSRGEKGGIIA